MRLVPTIILSAILLVALAPPGVAAETEEQTKTYLGGGWYARGNFNEEIYNGELLFDVAPGDTVMIDIRDVTGVTVAAYISFHAGPGYDGSLTGAAGESVGTEEICHQEIVEVPAEATRMRVVLNSPETMDMLSCQPQTATWGTITVASAN